MREKSIAIMITLTLVVLGIILGLMSSSFIIALLFNTSVPSYNGFNFYKSELFINGTIVKETLYFKTNKEYHTLYRTFESEITSKNDPDIKNSIEILSVDCKDGKPYFRFRDSCYSGPDFRVQETCEPYTENNEYGCTFGNIYGFNENTEYSISSEYIINPDNLFKINNRYYIKFIAYGKNNHIKLIKGKDFFISGDYESTMTYNPDEYVIIYIPYDKDISKYNIIEKSSFEYDARIEKNPPNTWTIVLITILIILFHMLPAIIFFCSWYFFGKEFIEPDVPDQRSDYPNKRKPWEVAAFFNPPFAVIDKNFFSSLLLDFYRRKIIDIRLKKGFFSDNLMIKINKYDKDKLDNIEKQFLNILETIKEKAHEDHFDGEYFNMNKSSSQMDLRFSLISLNKDLKSSLEKESKKYIEKKGIIFFALAMFILLFASFFTMMVILGIFTFITLFIILIISSSSSLLLRFKGVFYREYIEWQSFRKYLSYSPSMKDQGHKGVILWEEYLVYATALGVSKQVLKELKQQKIINEKQYNTYIGIHNATMSFASSGGGGGGFGGAGAGGVGGGGGGGR